MTDFDFDAARRERADGFIIGGERFALSDPGFKETADWLDQPAAEGGQAAADAQTLAFIEKFIDESDHERWRSRVDQTQQDAFTRGDIMGLAVWLMEQHAERPTIRSLSSGPGPKTAGTGSRPAVRLPVASPGA